MADILKYDMTDVWAVAGDVVAPDSAKIRAGWGVEVVPRQWWNWFENRQDNNIAYMLQKGFPEWDATTQYIINKSYVQRNGIVYRATATSTNSDPVALTSWVKAFPESSAALEALRVLTPAADKLAYFTSASAAATTTLTSFGRSIAALVDAAAARTLFSAQLSHANLTALSGVTANTNILPYFTSTSAMTGTSLTTFGRSLLDDADATAGRATLGLGTAATGTVTTSNTDTTAGRITRVGDFGESGGTGIQLANTDDANAINVSGSYTFANGGINLPTAASYYLKHNAHAVAGYAKQVALNLVSSTHFERTQVGGAWGGWTEVWTTNNLVKTTSTSDSTVGNMLKVGDFGLGTQGVRVGNLDGLPAIGTGLYTLGTPYSGSPVAGTPCSVIHTGYDNERTQIAITEGAATGRMFWRKYTGSAWGTWLEVVSTSALGTTLLSYALKGANSDITSLSGLTTALSVAQGGTGVTTSTGTGNTVLSASPTFTGTPLSTTAAPGTNTTQIATTAFVAALGALKANLASPALTGTPTAPTAAAGTNTTQLATTAFVAALGALKQDALGYTPVQQGTGVGQLTNLVKIGWSAAAKLKLTVDTSDLGNFAMESWVSGLIQTSLTDANAGRLMTVGAFGLGANGITVPSVSNITATINVGFYKFSGGATGAPPQFAGAGGSLIVHSLGGNFLQQIAISIPGALDSPMMCMRHYDTTGNPGAWVRMITTATVLGTVSVTSGLPTGAIIETGTNGNGTYTKFTDGTLINQGPIADLAVGSNAQATLSGNGTFPHPFISGAYYCQVMGAPSTSNDHYGFTSVNSRATTAVNYVHRNGATAQSMVNIRYLAIGRWF